MNRLRLPAGTDVALVPPSVEDQLNKRQKKMVELLVNGEELTSRMCEGIFGITRDTASRDFKKLISSEIATKIGGGRSTRYVLKVKS